MSGRDEGDTAFLGSAAALAALRGLLAAPPERADGRLPGERTLCRRLGVDRRALRRALEVLEAEGRVWRGRERGWFQAAPETQVPPLPPRDLLLEARLRLEPELAALAALRATPRDVANLRRLAARAAAGGDADARDLWGGALHRAVAEAARNPVLLAAFAALDARRAAEAARHPEAEGLAADPEVHAHMRRDHDKVVGAIAAGDADGAAEAMRAHLLSRAAAARRLRARGADGVPSKAGRG